MAPQLVLVGSGNIGQAHLFYCLPICLTLLDSLPAISRNLLLKQILGKPLILWNRTTSRATSLSEKIGHSNIAETVEDAVARSGINFSCFADEQGVFETFNTALKIYVKGELFVECSTVRPENIDTLNKKVLDAGGDLVAMPGLHLNYQATE